MSAEWIELRVAVIGGSAGSLPAYQDLLKALPVSCGIAYVVVQHRTATGESALEHLLAAATQLPVVAVAERVQLAADHVYVPPPGKALCFAEGWLHAHAEIAEPGPSRPAVIDGLCESLAVALGRRGALVVLSGALDDGTRGAQLVSGHGGLVLAQSPPTARYDAMPESAIAAGYVDHVLSPTGIAAALCAWGCTGRVTAQAVEAPDLHTEAASFAEIL